MNRFIGFRAVFDIPSEGRLRLVITGASVYRIRLNGQFIGYGPARGPHGYYRVDEIPLDDKMLFRKTDRPNIMTIELASYNVNSYYLLDQPGFLQAEIVADRGQVLAATGLADHGFKAYNLGYRVQKVPRYSFQRPFTEVYRLNEMTLSWFTGLNPGDCSELECEEFPEMEYMSRRVPFPAYNLRQPTEQIAVGSLERITPAPLPWKDRSMSRIVPPVFKGFPEDKLEAAPSLEIQRFSSSLTDDHVKYSPEESLNLSSHACNILDFGGNYSGFIGFSITVQKATKLFVTFDEILTENDIDFKRSSCIQLVSYDLAPGEYQLECYEPYTLRYLKFQTDEGHCAIKHIYLREYCNPDIQSEFACSSSEMNFLYDAGVETFRQNTVDIPMDCPSRERAGWLCDSFFTSRVAMEVSGHSQVEKNFLENYLLAPSFPRIPAEMFPECYPADHNDGCYIPQWALWLVLELDEYLNRSGDQSLIESYRPRIMSLLEWFSKFENKEGYLENVAGNNFLDASSANDYANGVSYPTNMLYAVALRAVDRLYRFPELSQKANMLVQKIKEDSFDGEFFVDNAIRSEYGVLKQTQNRSEACQYYAFFCDIATPDLYPDLWRILTTKFGPGRIKNNPYPDIPFANALVGNYLRMEVLSRYGLSSQVISEMRSYFLPMAEKTRTFWELMTEHASCNHGFASHVVHWLFKDIAGIQHIDYQKKTVTLRIPPSEISWCHVKQPLGKGILRVQWERNEKGEILWHVELPAGYRSI